MTTTDDESGTSLHELGSWEQFSHILQQQRERAEQALSAQDSQLETMDRQLAEEALAFEQRQSELCTVQQQIDGQRQELAEQQAALNPASQLQVSWQLEGSIAPRAQRRRAGEVDARIVGR
jgi:hypothetical protein